MYSQLVDMQPVVLPKWRAMHFTPKESVMSYFVLPTLMHLIIPPILHHQRIQTLQLIKQISRQQKQSLVAALRHKQVDTWCDMWRVQFVVTFEENSKHVIKSTGCNDIFRSINLQVFGFYNMYEYSVCHTAVALLWIKLTFSRHFICTRASVRWLVKEVLGLERSHRSRSEDSRGWWELSQRKFTLRSGETNIKAAL